MTLHHRIDGPKDAPVVVLGPSLGTTLDLWEPQLPELAKAWRVLRYDLPGHGGSPAPRAGAHRLTMGDLAGEVAALLDLYGLDRVACGGVSIGGAIGASLAVALPDRVAALVLCCTSAHFGPPAGWHERAARVRGEGMAPVVEGARGRWFTPGFADPEPQLAMLAGADPEGYAACCEAIAGFDLRGRLADIRAATLIIAGADDPATPLEHSRLLLDGIPDASLCVVSPAAHLANVERPAEVSEAMVRHLTAAWPAPGGGDR